MLDKFKVTYKLKHNKSFIAAMRFRSGYCIEDADHENRLGHVYEDIGQVC